MQYPPPKDPNSRDEKRASLAGRLNLAANDVNPFLIIVAVGLMILNLILYVGMSVSQHPPAWATPAASQSYSGSAYSAPSAASPSAPTADTSHK
jgi:hypothetical protein